MLLLLLVESLLVEKLLLVIGHLRLSLWCCLCVRCSRRTGFPAPSPRRESQIRRVGHLWRVAALHRWLLGDLWMCRGWRCGGRL